MELGPGSVVELDVLQNRLMIVNGKLIAKCECSYKRTFGIRITEIEVLMREWRPLIK